MQPTLKKAFIATIPVLAGYIFLGIAFGLLMNSHGFGLPLVLAMSMTIIFCLAVESVLVGYRKRNRFCFGRTSSI